MRVRAPEARTVHVRIESGRVSVRQALLREEGGYFTNTVEGARAGDRYRYRLDGEGPYPDPAACFQRSAARTSQLARPTTTQSGYAWVKRTTLEGPSHLDRDAQFHHISARIREFQADHQPVISVDTKE